MRYHNHYTKKTPKKTTKQTNKNNGPYTDEQN
jgi:hypothetical protein